MSPVSTPLETQSDMLGEYKNFDDYKMQQVCDFQIDEVDLIDIIISETDRKKMKRSVCKAAGLMSTIECID